MDYISLLESVTYEDQAIEHFGLTRNPMECGYILRDGRMLDFSGRHWDDTYRRGENNQNVRSDGRPDYFADDRTVDHRDLDWLDTDNPIGMFMAATGAIRCIPDVGFSILSPPSVKQIARMVSCARMYSNFVIDVFEEHHELQVVSSKEFAVVSARELVTYLSEVFGAEQITEAKTNKMLSLAALGLVGMSGVQGGKANTGQEVHMSMDQIQQMVDQHQQRAEPDTTHEPAPNAPSASQSEKNKAELKQQEPIAAQTTDVELPPDDINMLESDDPRIVMALTMWGEARSHGDFGMRAVGHVILNRAKENKRMFGGDSVVDVAKKRKQFSCWNHNDPNRQQMANVMNIEKRYPVSYARWIRALELADEILSGKSKDPTGGATYYHTTDIMPYWAESVEEIGTINNHVFYRIPA